MRNGNSILFIIWMQLIRRTQFTAISCWSCYSVIKFRDNSHLLSRNK